MFKDDYMMRQVDGLTRSIARLVFRKDTPEYRAGTTTGAVDGLYFELHTLVDSKRFNEAENLLYARSDPADIRYLEIAIDFYAHLNQLPDKELASGDFSRSEIEEGLRELMDCFGVILP